MRRWALGTGWGALGTGALVLVGLGGFLGCFRREGWGFGALGGKRCEAFSCHAGRVAAAGPVCPLPEHPSGATVCVPQQAVQLVLKHLKS